MEKLNKVEGIGQVFADKFAQAGITSTCQLLAAGKTEESRRALARSVGVTRRRLEQWVSQVDLARVKGIGAEYAELLRAAKVRSIEDLAKRDPLELHATLSSVNRERKLVRRVPATTRVEMWVSEARMLPSQIEFAMA